MRRVPFVVQPKVEIVPIGTPEIGIIHLLKKGGISPNENPVDAQQQSIKNGRYQFLVMRATKEMAEREGITKKEARARLFPSPSKSADGTAVEESDPMLMYDYLSAEEITEIFEMQDSQATAIIRAATLFVKYRVLYPVRLAAAAKASATELTVDPLIDKVDAQTKIRFGDQKVKVAEYAEPESELLRTEPLTAPMKADTIGYILNEQGREKIGDPEWTEADTRELLSEDLILKIYEFHQAEAGVIPEATDADLEDEGKSSTLKNSNDSADESLSNGAKSIGDSSSLELVTSA